MDIIQRLTSNVIDAFRFLSDKVIVVVNAAHQDEALELYTLPEPQEDTGGATMTMVARLKLPKTDWPIYSVTFCSPPTKNGIPRNNHQFINAAVSTRPFTKSLNNIIYCCMAVNNTREIECVSLIVHSSTLLRYATSQDFKLIWWNEWSPMARCVDEWECDAIDFSGQQWLRGNEIWDFNQYRVKQLGMDFSVETETARISVITKGPRIKALGNCAPSYSGILPYVRIVRK